MVRVSLCGSSCRGVGNLRHLFKGLVPSHEGYYSLRLCEHSFVSSQGYDFTRFRSALDQGNVSEALIAASALPSPPCWLLSHIRAS